MQIPVGHVSLEVKHRVEAPSRHVSAAGCGILRWKVGHIKVLFSSQLDYSSSWTALNERVEPRAFVRCLVLYVFSSCRECWNVTIIVPLPSPYSALVARRCVVRFLSFDLRGLNEGFLEAHIWMSNHDWQFALSRRLITVNTKWQPSVIILYSDRKCSHPLVCVCSRLEWNPSRSRTFSNWSKGDDWRTCATNVRSCSRRSTTLSRRLIRRSRIWDKCVREK